MNKEEDEELLNNRIKLVAENIINDLCLGSFGLNKKEMKIYFKVLEETINKAIKKYKGIKFKDDH